MTTRSVNFPYEIFRDLNGEPLENGSIYIGVANLDPVTNPIAVYWDAALTIPAAQPIPTINGYPSRGGSPGVIYADSAYSVLVRDKRGALIISVPLVDLDYPIYTADTLYYRQPLTGAVTLPISSKVGESISVKDFGAVGDGVADDTTALQAAIDTNKPLYFPAGTYKYSGLTGLSRSGLSLRGDGSHNTILKYTGTGYGIDIDGSVGGLFIQNTQLEGLTVEGNSATDACIRAKKMARSQWRDVNVREADATTGAGVLFQGVMLSRFESLVCSQDLNAMTTAPYEGLRIEATSIDGNSSNNVFVNPYFEGAGTAPNSISIGIRIAGGSQNVFLGGSAESCKTWGLLIGTDCNYNAFLGVGFENLGASGDFADAGDSTVFNGCYSSVKAIWQGQRSKVSAGTYERVQIDAGAVKNSFENIEVNHWRSGAGGFFDSGTATGWKNLIGTTVTASFATNVMTVTAVRPGDVLAIGQKVIADGVANGTTIASLGTGTGGTGTYNLSTSPGTLGSRAVQTLAPIYPYGEQTTIPVGVSPFFWTNNTGRVVGVQIINGTVSAVRQYRRGDSWLIGESSPNYQLLMPSDSVQVTYSSVPDMTYIPMDILQG
jgi:hypothetical protein